MLIDSSIHFPKTKNQYLQNNTRLQSLSFSPSEASGKEDLHEVAPIYWISPLAIFLFEKKQSVNLHRYGVNEEQNNNTYRECKKKQEPK